MIFFDDRRILRAFFETILVLTKRIKGNII